MGKTESRGNGILSTYDAMPDHPCDAKEFTGGIWTCITVLVGAG